MEQFFTAIIVSGDLYGEQHVQNVRCWDAEGGNAVCGLPSFRLAVSVAMPQLITLDKQCLAAERQRGNMTSAAVQLAAFQKQARLAQLPLVHVAHCSQVTLKQSLEVGMHELLNPAFCSQPVTSKLQRAMPS